MIVCMHSCGTITIEHVVVSILLISTVIYVNLKLDDESNKKVASFAVLV